MGEICYHAGMRTLSAMALSDMLALPGDDRLLELVDGELVEKDTGFLSGYVASQVCRRFQNQLDDRGLGFSATEILFRASAWGDDHARRPDVIYVARQRMSGGIPTQDILRVAPDVCVQVLSPNDDAIEVDRKVEESREAGVLLTIVINPETRTLLLVRKDGSTRRLYAHDTLGDEPALPGLSVEIAKLFPTQG